MIHFEYTSARFVFSEVNIDISKIIGHYRDREEYTQFKYSCLKEE